MNGSIILVVISVFLCIVSIGCFDQPVINDTIEHDEESAPLSDIGLSNSDFSTVKDLVYEDHVATPYERWNLTGNNINWYIVEGYFSTFVCNESRVSQSLLRFDSEENATRNVQLHRQQLIGQNHSEQLIDSIGNLSFLVYISQPFGNGTIDVWTLDFSFEVIVVSIVGIGSTKDEMIQYASSIMDRISMYDA